MSDLPMRERLLAVMNPVGWAQVERLRAEGTPDAEALQVVGHNVEMLDRLLTVLADLPDTAVEVGAKLVYVRSGGTEEGWEYQPEWFKEDRREDFTEVHADFIAAIKEGKA